MFLSGLLLIAAQAPRLQVGSTWSATESCHYVNPTAEIDETHRYNVTFRITGEDAHMWVVEKRSTLAGSRIADTDLPPPPKQLPDVTKQLLSPAGFLLDSTPFDRGRFYLDRLVEYWLPRNNPDEWTADLSTESQHVIVRGRADFKRSAKGDDYTFTYTTTDNPDDLSARGTMRFESATGRLLAAKIWAKNAVIPGGRDRADAEIIYTANP